MTKNALLHRHRLVFAGLVAVIAAVVVSWPGLLRAQPSDRDQSELGVVYRKGKTAYDLGNFEEAIKYFKQAYAIQPHEAHLYNIAQAYRQAGDCRNALFFYKRYVAVGGEKARHYRVVQRRIKELTESCKVIDDMKNEPPLDSLDPDKGENVASGEPARDTKTRADASGAAGAAGGTVTESVEEDAGASDPVLAASLELGGAILDIGALDVTGAHFSLGVGAGYPLVFGDLALTLGGLFTYTPVPWTNEVMDTSGTSSLIGVLGNVGARYAVAGKLALRLEVGAGALLLAGASQGSVFVPDGMKASGVLSMFNLRAGVGAEYLLTESLVFSVSPLVYSFSPAKEGLREGVDRFVRFDFIAGVGFRM